MELSILLVRNLGREFSLNGTIIFNIIHWILPVICIIFLGIKHATTNRWRFWRFLFLGLLINLSVALNPSFIVNLFIGSIGVIILGLLSYPREKSNIKILPFMFLSITAFGLPAILTAITLKDVIIHRNMDILVFLFVAVLVSLAIREITYLSDENWAP